MDESALNAGKLIRELRRQRNMTGEELAKRAGLSQPKISRIENNTFTPKAAEIEKILNILDASQTIRQQITGIIQIRPAATHKVRGRYLHIYKLAAELDRRTRHSRNFAINIIPAILQTAEFRRSLLEHIEITPEEIKMRMKVNTERQDRIWEQRRSYHLLLHEITLYTMPGNRRVQLAQLDRIERMLGVKNVAIGIIPVQSGLLAAAHSSFSVLDDMYLFKDAPGEEIMSRDAAEIALYLKLFAQLERLAAYDDECLQLIARAKKVL